MAINYTDLFTKLGKLGKTINSINTYRGTTNPALIAEIVTAYDGDEDLIPSIQNTNTTGQNSYGSVISALQTIAQNTVVNLVNEDNPQPNTTVTTALTELISQMTDDSQSIQQNTVSAAVAYGGSNVGDGIVTVSVLNEYGADLQMCYAEDIVITCTQDAQTGFLTEGKEQFSIKGEYAESNALSPNYPRGSACSVSVNAVSALEDSGDNFLINGGFDTATISNIPDNWEAITGSAGTEILVNSDTPYTGTDYLAFADGVDPKIAQTFGDSTATTGTDSTLFPNTVYSLSFWVKESGSPASGSLTVRLYDVTNSAVMADDAGTNNSYSVNLTSLTTTWTNRTTVFRTPKDLPASYRLEILATSIPASGVVAFDHMSLSEMTQLYNNGPFVAIHSGATEFIVTDTATITVSNNYTGAWQTMLERLFSLNKNKLIVPSSATPTIADRLVGAGFISRPISNGNTLWQTYDYTNMERVAVYPDDSSLWLDESGVVAGGTADNGERQTYNFDPPGIPSTELVLWYFATATSYTGNATADIRINGVTETPQVMTADATWRSLTFTGSWTAADFVSEFQAGFTCPTLGSLGTFVIYAAYVEIT